ASVATPGPTAAPPTAARPRRPDPDYPLAGVAGRFFTQTAKDGQGFSVADRGADRDGRPTRWWSEFLRLGGLDALGYPISRVYTGPDGFLYQAFQRGVLQWRPEAGRAMLANTLDFLADAGADDWAYSRGVPRQIKDDGSNGDFAKAVETRLGWLTEPAIARRYRLGPDPVGQPTWSLDDSIALYGLPSSRPEKFGPFVVQRFQRVAFQYWVEDVPGMPTRGSVVPILAGDLLADAGLVPASARVAESPPD
ncbi:MAG: hypothetical protein NZ518_04620, partial [Dehalococcoidia bacterium]|nr:hypothetical protein [Dehalococcoidia bacterium]